jgi:diguanylate cyclase (GGDEF)-like protein
VTLRRGGSYSPHRALIAPGTILITVAVAGGTLGTVESARAERSAALLNNRFLVLQPPVRAARAAVANFQLLAEQAFAGESSPALLASAVVGSAAVDQSYLALHRYLSLPVNASLAPDLARRYRIYVASRTGLATLLTTGARSPQSALVAAAEQAADKSLDAAFASLQSTITTFLVKTANQVQAAASDARNSLLASLGLGVAFGVAITAMLTRKALRLERELAGRDAVQARVTRRNEFEGRLQRALEMAKDEAPVFELVTVALHDAAPDLRAELLLADSSRAHFQQVLVSSAGSNDLGCAVVSPDDCPAASRGQTMIFPESTALDACPYLRGRACSALCVPVSISGNSVGVVHVTAVDGSPPSAEVRRDVEVVVTRASERLAMLRAFQVSKTEANSDSLTGLLTRRSLQNQVRDLQESGLSYALAYGDLDHFKQLNDVFGHDAGDRALRMFSQVLRDALRPSDIPCRYGGEEFVIMLPSCTIAEAVTVLERVMDRIALRLESGHLPTFTVSFGVASSDQAEDFEHVVALADDALLRAKAAGRDQIVVARSGEPAGPTLTRASDRSGPTPPADAADVPDSARSATPLLLVTPS